MAAMAAGLSGSPVTATAGGDRGAAAAARGGVSLRDLTRTALEQILAQGARDGRVEWTVLIIDDFARDVIAPIMKVGDLRALGITLHLPLLGKRNPIPDAPAVYLCRPSEEACKRIAADCCEDMYRSFAVHFLAPVSRPRLELLAQELLPRQSLANIRVKDQFLSFVSPESDLFSLQIKDSYYMCSSSRGVTEANVMEFLDNLTNGIVHVLLTLQMVPIVVSVKTGPASMLAQKVVDRIHDMVRESYLAPHASAHRPVLIICDRSQDIATGLAHNFTYRCLLHDVLGMHLNKVHITVDSVPRVCELDEKDPLWREIRSGDFGEVSDRVSKEGSDFLQVKDRLTGRRGDDSAVPDDAEDADRLSAAMTQAGAMAQRKRYLDDHTNLSVALTSKVRARRLDMLSALTDQIVRGERPDKQEFAACSRKHGTVEDRVRFGCVHYLASDTDDTKAADYAAETEKLLMPQEKPVDAGAAAAAAEAPAAAGPAPSAAAFKYLRRQRGMQVPGSAGGASPRTSDKNFFGLAGAGTRKGMDFLTTGLKAASSAFKQGSAHAWLPHTRIVDAVLQGQTSAKKQEERAKFLRSLNCVEPKTKQTIELTQFQFSTAICFVVGGGNYVEYENLKEWEREEEGSGKRVIYGTSELVGGETFLQQLAELGAEG